MSQTYKASLMSEALRFSGVHYSYPSAGGEEALRGVTFSIDKGEKVALLGLNGAGKSTLLLQTNGLLSPASGRVDVDGVALTKKTVTLARQKVGMVFQNADDQLFSPTVYADVAFGPQMMKLPADEVDRRVREALEGIGASRLIDRQTTRLSGGERRMVAIATVLSMRPSILVLTNRHLISTCVPGMPFAHCCGGSRRRCCLPLIISTSRATYVPARFSSTGDVWFSTDPPMRLSTAWYRSQARTAENRCFVFIAYIGRLVMI